MTERFSIPLNAIELMMLPQSSICNSYIHTQSFCGCTSGACTLHGSLDTDLMVFQPHLIAEASLRSNLRSLQSQ